MLRWVLKIFRKPKATLSSGSVPQHIAIIMDGNGRWAQRRGLPRVAGHRVGADSLKDIVKACAEFGVKYLTVYAFSTENWERPKDEVDFLMGFLGETIDREVAELNKNNVRLKFLGRLSRLPKNLQDKISESMQLLSKNTGLNLQVMLNYGGRAEIVDAVRASISKAKNEEEINEALLGSNLYTAGIPDPDLLIRTGGDLRVSNFLLWQIAYAEILVTKTLWPDFRRRSLIEALQEYQQRQRRFGRV